MNGKHCYDVLEFPYWLLTYEIALQNWKEMTHDWMDGVLRFLLSAPVRLAFWTLFGNQVYFH